VVRPGSLARARRDPQRDGREQQLAAGDDGDGAQQRRESEGA